MATPTLPEVPSVVLADLLAARSIIESARVSISDGPMKPWEKLNNATKYLTRQMDEALAPMFSDEAELCQHESPESFPGACDGGYPCSNLAVSDGACAKHLEAM